jgi:hypothetical protein
MPIGAEVFDQKAKIEVLFGGSQSLQQKCIVIPI